jgi:hypothetical protein
MAEQAHGRPARRAIVVGSRWPRQAGALAQAALDRVDRRLPGFEALDRSGRCAIADGLLGFENGRSRTRQRRRYRNPFRHFTYIRRVCIDSGNPPSRWAGSRACRAAGGFGPGRPGGAGASKSAFRSARKGRAFLGREVQLGGAGPQQRLGHPVELQDAREDRFQVPAVKPGPHVLAKLTDGREGRPGRRDGGRGGRVPQGEPDAAMVKR